MRLCLSLEHVPHVSSVRGAGRDRRARALLGRAPGSLPGAGPRVALELGARPPLAAAGEAVLALRRPQRMVLDPSDPDSVSAGSFFLNPVMSVERLAEVERRVSERLVSTKHSLALVNRGGSTGELIALAREIRRRVPESFGLMLRPEPTLVGVEL